MPDSGEICCPGRRAAITPRSGYALWVWRQFCGFPLARCAVCAARYVGDVCADRDVVPAEALHQIFNVVDHRIEVAAAPEERSEAVHADVTPGIRNGADHFIRLGTY